MRRLVQHSAIRQLLPASAHERLLPTFSAREVVIILSSAREDAVTCIPITQQGTWRQLPAYYIAKAQGPAAGLWNENDGSNASFSACEDVISSQRMRGRHYQSVRERRQAISTAQAQRHEAVL